MKLCKAHVSKRSLSEASAYRRMVKYHAGLDFSYAAMQAQYAHESTGAPKPDQRTNGYTLGKWVMDVTIAAMREDLEQGSVCKWELCKGSPALVRKVISRLPTSTLFTRR